MHQELWKRGRRLTQQVLSRRSTGGGELASAESEQHAEHELMCLSLEDVKRTIAVMTDPIELKALRDKAGAARKYFQAADLGLEMQNRVAEIKLRAERRAGAILADLKLCGGNRKSNNRDDRLILKKLGITQNQSTRWQKEASVAEETFEAYVRLGHEQKRELTTAGLLRLGNGKGAGKNGRGSKDRNEPGRKGETGTYRSQLVDCVHEARDHVGWIIDTLKPVYEGGELHPAQRRHLKRVMGEVEKLLEEAAASANSVPTNPPR